MNIDDQGDGRPPRRIPLVDIERAVTLPPDACPRRYCFWWDSDFFLWEKSVGFGCRFPRYSKPPGTLLADRRCNRDVPGPPIDHYEPDETAIESDGVDATHWIIRRNQVVAHIRAMRAERGLET